MMRTWCIRSAVSYTYYEYCCTYIHICTIPGTQPCQAVRRSRRGSKLKGASNEQPEALLRAHKAQTRPEVGKLFAHNGKARHLTILLTRVQHYTSISVVFSTYVQYQVPGTRTRY